MYKYNKCIGTYGEALCENYLMKNNYIIICKNFRCKIGEIDIICRDKKTNHICFVEVKSRYNNLYGRPCESVTYKKIKKIKTVAKFYISKYNLFKYNFRFDVVEIIFDIKNNNYSISTIKNAF